MNVLPLRSFRLVCKVSDIPLAEALLHAQGFRFMPEPFSVFARRLLHEPIPLGSSLAAIFGYIYIQDRSSMLPPLALAPAPGDTVLDMCASPGSKTGFLGQLVGPGGFILGNEPSRNRLATLRRNLINLNLFNCGTTSHPGERLLLPPSRWSRILLDPPCSGWGTAEKNPKVMQLWQGDKVKPLIALQRRLLAEAYRLLLPGGTLVYSTCTTNVAENEEQIRHAREALGLESIPLAPLPGFSFADSALPGVDGVLRVEAGEDGQGFFVGLLRKPASGDTYAEPAELTETGAFTPSGDVGLSSPMRRDRAGADRRPARGQAKGKRPSAGLGGFEFLSREALAPSWTDPKCLPPGDIAVFNEVAHFLPAPSRHVLPEGFAWKGFPLGRLVDGGVRVNPALHGLMPARDKAGAQGVACLDLDTIEPLLGMLTGQGLAMEAGLSECLLYFQGLPLCRLSVKGRRAVLPPL